MSIKVYKLVQSRVVGSSAAKAVLLNMAARADDQGKGVFPSKASIAAETELSLPTVKREIKALLVRRLIRETGETRPCANGHTVVYDLEIDEIRALPEWKKGRRIGAQKPETGITVNPVQDEPGSSRTPTRFTVNPDPVHSEPLIVLERSLKDSAGARAPSAGSARTRAATLVATVEDDGASQPAPRGSEIPQAKRDSLVREALGREAVPINRGDAEQRVDPTSGGLSAAPEAVPRGPLEASGAL
ncbi:helix-turn-helix domain-containing protein [Paracoccus ravus]|uniref:helix-turn-helix domain-containing protein n=1 Tax=Paracoccus ravus TaxID=2447760 RepID=UPI00106E9F8B|nr:helix-turn-helix domain-containing protein [Paracoccus ravus]